MNTKGIGINIDSPTIDGDLDLFEKALGDFQDIGFDYVEIPIHGVDAIFKGKLNWLQTRAITDILKEFKLKYTVHGLNLLNLMDPSNFQLQKDIFKSGLELKPRYKKFYKYSLQKLEEFVESTNNNHKLKEISPFSKHHH